MPRSSSSSSRSSSPKFGSSYTTYRIPASFSHNGPIIPPASHKIYTPTPPKPPVTPVAPVAPPPAYLPQERTFGQTIKEGFGFGMGSAIANRIFGRPPVVVENKTVTETPSVTSVTHVAPSINSSDSSQKVSYNDCMKQLYEKCMVNKSHEECQKFNPFDTSSQRISYSECMSDMYYECGKTNSSKNCSKYLI